MSNEIFTYINTSTADSTEGYLSGKRIAIQANMSVRGWPTDAGSTALKSFHALENATVVDSLKLSGAHIVGSIRMSEFGLGLIGDTSKNAINGGHTDIVMITDYMGEARIAAALAGVFGFKPTFGIVSRYGLVGLIPSMEAFGIVAKKPDDICAVLSVIAHPDEKDFSMSEVGFPEMASLEKDKKFRSSLGVIRESSEFLRKDELSIFHEKINLLSTSGWQIQEISMPDFELLPALHNVIGSVEASSNCGRYDGVRYGHRAPGTKNWNEMYLKTRGESFGTFIKAFLIQGAYFQFKNYEAFQNACRIRARLLERIRNIFNMVDMIIMPAKRQDYPANEIKSIPETYEAFYFTIAANLLGCPAIYVSDNKTHDSMDPGLQIIGDMGADLRIIGAAKEITSLIKGEVNI